MPSGSDVLAIANRGKQRLLEDFFVSPADSLRDCLSSNPKFLCKLVEAYFAWRCKISLLDGEDEGLPLFLRKIESVAEVKFLGQRISPFDMDGDVLFDNGVVEL